MCGIYGFKARTGEELTQFESTALTTHLARRMESRGRDSWGGVILPDPNSDNIEARIFKNVGRVTETGFNMFRAASTAQAFLGHTRAATVGKVSVENSHPFLVGEVLGVHNGSIYNYDELNTKYNRTFEVDSTQIFAHINDSLDLSEIEGAGTFFYTKRDEEWKHIYLAKTSNGSLYVARFFRDSRKKQGTHFAIVWASERSAVEEAAALIGATQQEISISSGQLYAIS
jgi:predicted glutamine amidotransferase